MEKINLDAEFSTNQAKAKLLVMIRSLDILSENFEEKCRESARKNFESADISSNQSNRTEIVVQSVIIWRKC
jgi:hypothetical protein